MQIKDFLFHNNDNYYLSLHKINIKFMKINKQVLTLLFSFLLFNGFSQTIPITKTWGLSSEEEQTTAILEINNNSFIVSSSRFNNDTIWNKESVILKLDSNCNVIDSLNLINYHKKGKYYFLERLFNFNNQIIGNGYSVDSISYKVQIWFSVLNADLSIKQDTLLGNEDSLMGLLTCSFLATSQNKLLAAIFYTTDSTTFAHDSTNTLIWVLDTNFCIIQENSIYTNFGYHGTSVVEMISNQTYHIITENDITIINQNDLMVKSIVVNGIFDGFIGSSGAKSINDSTYIITVPQPFWTNIIDGKFGMNTWLFTRDKNGTLKDTIKIGNMLEQFDKIAIDDFAFTTLDSIFVTGSNFSLDSNFISYEDNTIYLWNVNLNGDINWQKYYGIGKKFSVVDIQKTSDGGCFIIGVLWNWHNYPQYTTDLFFLKLDRNGNITGTQGINEITVQNDILVYPNPTKDILTIETNSNTEQRLEIVNLIGQTVYTNIIYKKATVNKIGRAHV